MATDEPVEISAEEERNSSEVFPYSIHVSTKYLEITRQKLELTRLPHEPRSKDWWEPKPQVESLIDYWQEHYSWPKFEERFNTTVPQFRTSFQSPPPATAVRMHFVHVRSPHQNAVPLLLIPPFPLTNLSMIHLISPLTNPLDPGMQQPFHLVIPALPGLGFSDPLPNSAAPISTTAKMMDDLMKRLSYPRYLATNAGSASLSPAGVDWRVIKHLSQNFTDSCLGAHFIAPPLSVPKLGTSALEWTKWTLARSMGASVLGYSKDDFSAVTRTKSQPERKTATPFGNLNYDDSEPNTPAYALCDSPTGLLLWVLKILRTLGPKKELTPDDIITLTQLVWLPGPEAVLRFWAHCASQIEPVESMKPKRKSKVAVTVFLGNEDESELQKALPRPAKSSYSCPSWAKSEYNVVYTNRATGRAGFLSWDRPEVIIDGVRGLAKAILAVDTRMQRTATKNPAPTLEIPVETPETEAADLAGSSTARDSAVGTDLSTTEPHGKAPMDAGYRQPTTEELTPLPDSHSPGPSPRSQRYSNRSPGEASR